MKINNNLKDMTSTSSKKNEQVKKTTFVQTTKNETIEF